MTDRFADSVRAVAAAEGLPEYPFIVIEHPIAHDDDQALRRKAEEIGAGLVPLLTRRIRRWS